MLRLALVYGAFYGNVMPPQPFKIKIPDSIISQILKKVADYNWHEMPSDEGWSYGTNLNYMKELCTYWCDQYDWRQHENQLNKWDQYKSTVDGIDIHFIHEKGSGPNPLPLLISHGWPGSVYEFMDVIEPLAHPERFGGSAKDSFDVIAPSLPGFAFSGKPDLPLGPRKIAGIFSTLMKDELGYKSFLAQGGDWGSAISSWLGYDHAPSCLGIHINMLTMRNKAGAQTQEEREWENQVGKLGEEELGYNYIQSTKPQTLSYAMMDSPVGVAAWLLEKFNTWSDTSGEDPESAYTKDQLLTNIMIYLVTRSFNTASWIYYGRMQEGGRTFPEPNKGVEIPVSAALFPAEFLPWAPKSYVERIYNIVRWTEMPHGGHFAAMEQPELLVEDVREFGRSFR